MNKSKRLQPVVKLAQDREQSAARTLGEAQRLVQQRQARLEELLNYRDEYRNQFMQEGEVGYSAARLNDFRAFLVKLDKAIDQQAKLVDAGLKELEDKKRLWMQRRSKSLALEKVTDKYRQQELAEELRREQKETDERAHRHGHCAHDTDEES